MNKYEEFRKILDTSPAGAPASESFDEILKILFSEEDIDLLLHMSFKTKTAGQIASAASSELNAVTARLEAMADRGVIYHKIKEGVTSYGILPTIPGIFEFPFISGKMEADHGRLTELWDNYKHDGMAKSFAGNPTPLMRIVPAEHSIDTKNVVYQYDEVSKIIDEADYISIGPCACRTSSKRCDKPIDVCIFLGLMGKYLAERGFSKEATKEEAKATLDKAEEAGLVHSSTNTHKGAGVICNCCSCCCTVLRGRFEYNMRDSFAQGTYMAQVKNDTCSGCGICIEERCPAKAITLMDTGIVSVNIENCIGCGLCVSGCPVSAMEMVKRPEIIDTPPTIQQLGAQVLTEKGKLSAYLEVMKK